MKTRFFPLSIRSLTLLFCLPFVLLVLLSCSYFYRAGKDEITGLVQANANAIINQAASVLEQKITAVINLSTTITASSYYFKLRENIIAGREAITAENYRNFSNRAYDFLYMNSNYFDSVFLYLDDGSISMFRSNSGERLQRLQFDYEEFSRLYPPYSLNWFSCESRPCPYSTLSGDLPANALIEIFGTRSSSVHGVMVFGINNELFTSSLANSKITASACLTLVKDGKLQFKSHGLFGTDTLEKLSESDLNAISLLACSDANQMNIHQILDGNYVIYHPLAYENMGILAVIPIEEMEMKHHHFSMAALEFSVLLLTACLAFYFMITHLLTRPISSLMDQLNHISENNLNTMIKSCGGREIRHICNGINLMIGRMKSLMNNLEIEIMAKQEAKLQALYYQINPHFLYNALDCIHQLCDMGEVKKAGQMADQLAAFYRTGVSKGLVEIPFKDELTHVEMYLAILKTRFEDFQYQILVPKELGHYPIIKLVLQPIVENAIYHGLRPFRRDGTLKISAEKRNGSLLIYVSDDGSGIPEHKLADIRSALHGSMSEKPLSVYGIKNVHDRIQLAYGRSYGLCIDSVPEEGTTVTLRIPIRPLGQRDAFRSPPNAQGKIRRDKNDDSNTICR